MIKKLIGYGMLAVTAMAAPVAMAQDSENLDVWKRNKGINLSYITHQSLKGEMGSSRKHGAYVKLGN